MLPIPVIDKSDDTEEMTNPFSVLALCVGRGVAGELLVDPVKYGWRRALRIVGYLRSWVREISGSDEISQFDEITWSDEIAWFDLISWSDEFYWSDRSIGQMR